MEKLLNPYQKEYMRMAMLKHEETFKQQVYELHRLYKVQKILMKNAEMDRSKQEVRIQEKIKNDGKMGIGFIRRVEDVDVREDLRTKLGLDRQVDFGGSDREMIDESEVELTLGPTCYGRRLRKKSSSVLDYGRSLSWSSTGSIADNGTSQVIVEEQAMQEMGLIKQQPWLHALSLNVS